MKQKNVYLKSISIILCAFMVLISIMSLKNLVIADAATASGSTTINPSNSDFKEAKKPKYSSADIMLYGYLDSYELDIYHFEAPYQGYYAIYTMGELDTVGAIYEEQNFLWWTTEYKFLGSNDDGCMISNRYNFSMVQKFDRGEDYYICVRGYGTSKGNYTLVIEPNQDKMISENGGVWDCSSLSDSAAMLGVWTNQKQYLTKEQVLLFYWFLDPATRENIDYSLDVVYSAYNKDTALAISLCNEILDLLLAPTEIYISLPVSVLGSILDYCYSASEVTAYDMMEILHDKCGVNHDPYRGVWSVSSGLLISQLFIKNSIPAFNYIYEANNDTLLTGEAYSYGTWTK